MHVWLGVTGTLVLCGLAICRIHRRYLRIARAQLLHSAKRHAATLLAPSPGLLLALVLLADAAALSVVHTVWTFVLNGLYLTAGLASATVVPYLIGCGFAARESRRFAPRLAAKVRNAEVVGLSPRALERLQRADLLSEHDLYLLCRENGLTAVFHRERQEHALRLISLSQSVPLVRLLALLAWQPQVTPLDVTALLNSIVLYTCTVGLPMLGIAAAFKPRSPVTIAFNLLCALIALANVAFDLPHRLLELHGRASGTHGSRALSTAEAMQATADFVHEVGKRWLVDGRRSLMFSDGSSGEAVAESLLNLVFRLKEEQIFCLQRQSWTNEQLQLATRYTSSGASSEGVHLTRKLRRRQRALTAPQDAKVVV